MGIAYHQRWEDDLLSDPRLANTKQTTVVAWVSHMLTDSRLWPDADAFVPGRWLDERYKGVEADRKAYLPFASGSRSCIGQK